MNINLNTFISELNEHRAMIEQLESCTEVIESAAKLLIESLQHNGKILLCGNGGSAADCQHIAAELVVRYKKNRPGIPAIALTTDSSILTAHANDLEFATVFARQIETLGNNKDTLIAISTSGNSENIVRAAKAAMLKGLTVIGLTGNDGGELCKYVTEAVIVPSSITARIQEAHILIGHWWCNKIEEALSNDSST